MIRNSVYASRTLEQGLGVHSRVPTVRFGIRLAEKVTIRFDLQDGGDVSQLDFYKTWLTRVLAIIFVEKFVINTVLC